jgi:uncharacterized protein (DUF433 family)
MGTEHIPTTMAGVDHEPNVVDLLERPVYGLVQVDRLLALHPGTARRWVEGYERRGKTYPPVVRIEPTGSDVVTWGEFVEARLLSEYRDKGVPMVRMRPAIELLREQFNTKYPLATAHPYVGGKELLLQVQEKVGLESALRLIVIRSNQLVFTPPVEHFLASVEWSEPTKGVVLRLHPLTGNPVVVVDPLRQFGEPVVRSVQTEVIAEQFDAGASIEAIASLYELDRREVEAALRYERERVKAQAPTAA